MAHPNYRKIEGWLESAGIREMIDESLPDGMSTDAWINSALTHIGSDKDVLNSVPESTLGAILEAATLGVRFEGPLGEAYLESRASKFKADDGTWQWQRLTQLQVQYRGLMKLARRDPLVRKVEAIIVHEHDSFAHQLGSDPFLNHTWDVRKPRGKMVAVYAALRYHDGFYDFGQPYPMTAIFKHRDRVLADKNIRVERRDDGSEVFWKRWKENEPEKEMNAAAIRRVPWITYIEAMAQKTAVRWSAKFWDLSPEFDKPAALISLAESGRGQSLAEVATNVVGTSIEADDQPTTAGDGAAQGVSLTRMGSLKQQMLAETGVQVDDAPREEDTHVEPDQDPGPDHEDGVDQSEGTGDEPTPEEQEEILARERAEAEEFEREQHKQKDDFFGDGDQSGGRRGAKKNGTGRGRRKN